MPGSGVAVGVGVGVIVGVAVGGGLTLTETSIEVALPMASQVRLEIYNITGQRVRTLMQGRHEAGFHRVLWNGKDDRGREVPSGVYFYAISAVELGGKEKAHREVKKMVLIK